MYNSKQPWNAPYFKLARLGIVTNIYDTAYIITSFHKLQTNSFNLNLPNRINLYEHQWIVKDSYITHQVLAINNTWNIHKLLTLLGFKDT